MTQRVGAPNNLGVCVFMFDLGPGIVLSLTMQLQPLCECVSYKTLVWCTRMYLCLFVCIN